MLNSWWEDVEGKAALAESTERMEQRAAMQEDAQIEWLRGALERVSDHLEARAIKAESDRDGLRAELDDLRLQIAEASSPFPKGYWIERTVRADATIARVRVLCDWAARSNGGFITLPDVLRALDGAA